MPVLIDGVALLAALLVCIVCYMLLVAYKSTLGALLGVLVNALDVDIPFVGHVFHFLASGILALDSAINAALVDGVDGSRWALAKMFNFTALLIDRTYDAIAHAAETQYNAVRWVVDHLIPSAIGAAVKPLHGAVKSLSHQLAYLWRVVGNLAHAVAHTADTTVPRVIQRTVTVTRVEVEKQTKTVVQAVAGTLPQVGSIGRTIHGIDETLKETLRKLSPAALAGVFVGSILSLAGMTWLRCGNVRRVGRAVCGLNANTLEGLLAGLLSIFGTIGIVKFAGDIQDVVADFGGEVTHFWRADLAGPGGDRKLGSATLD